LYRILWGARIETAIGFFQNPLNGCTLGVPSLNLVSERIGHSQKRVTFSVFSITNAHHQLRYLLQSKQTYVGGVKNHARKFAKFSHTSNEGESLLYSGLPAPL
jgi:hypothetical protein